MARRGPSYPAVQTESPGQSQEFVGGWSNPKAQKVIAGYGDEKITITRAAGHADAELVFIETGHETIWLTREQAADLAEAVHETSGMATSTYGAQFLAAAHRDSIASKGLTQSRICDVVGVTRHRLRKLLAGTTPMTVSEHKAISQMEAGR